ncbi:DUF2244 domain-containing protein [Panacagrimonas sp.]|uniref:DUF2244 domain-containing protein n=1 Tax=Panacagrimonas sp. TaxID=2480088 RepID=UPI003B521F82
MSQTHDTTFVIGPNASLSLRGACWFMGSISAVTLGGALWFTAHGFWPVLPFAGLELAAVGWGLAVSMRRSRYREVVNLGERTVRVEFGVAGQGCSARAELPRAWTRVEVERKRGNRHAPTRLVLSSSGQRIVIGRCLTDEEREQLSTRLKQVLRTTPAHPDPVLPAHTTPGEG